MFCTSCGADLGARALRFCLQCGVPLQTKNVLTALHPASIPDDAPVTLLSGHRAIKTLREQASALLSVPKAIGLPHPVPQPNAPDASPAQTLHLSDRNNRQGHRKKKQKHKKARDRAKLSVQATGANEPINPTIPLFPTPPVAAIQDEPALPPAPETVPPPLFLERDDRIVVDPPYPRLSLAPTEPFIPPLPTEESFILPTAPVAEAQDEPAPYSLVEATPPASPGWSDRIVVDPPYPEAVSAPVQVIRRGKSAHSAVLGIAIVALILLLGGLWWWSSEEMENLPENTDVTLSAPSSESLPDARPSFFTPSPSAPEAPIPDREPGPGAEQEPGSVLMSIPSLPTNQRGRHNRNNMTEGATEPLAPLPLPVPAPPPAPLPTWEEVTTTPSEPVEAIAPEWMTAPEHPALAQPDAQ